MNGHVDQWFGGETFSQHGEDLLFCSIFDQLSIRKGRYVDVGCNHPMNISNTHLLFERGWSGVNIDPSPDVMEVFRRCRPNDINLCIAVGPENRTGTLYVIDRYSGRNTLVKAEADRFVAENPDFAIREEVPVRVVTLDSILAQWPCDLLSIDCEGLDFEILVGCSFPTRPSVICVETRGSQASEIKSVLRARGYAPLVRMGENLVFVADELIGMLR